MSERTLAVGDSSKEQEIRVCFVTLVVLTLVTLPTFGQVVVPGGYSFEDDFDDGFINDGIPARWGTGAWSGATLRVLEGDVAIDGCRNGYCAIAPRDSTNTSYLGYTDTVVRTQARISQVNDGGTRIGIFTRSTAPTGYFGRIDHRGEVVVFEAPTPGVGNVLARVDTDLDPVNNDVWMEFSTIGEQIEFRVWEDGTSVPEEPLVSVESRLFPWGTFGLYVESVGSMPGSGVFRWASVSDVPEPTSASLLVCAALACLAYGRSRLRC